MTEESEGRTEILEFNFGFFLGGEGGKKKMPKSPLPAAATAAGRCVERVGVSHMRDFFIHVLNNFH